MKLLSKAVLIGCALTLSACGSGRFGDAGGGANGANGSLGSDIATSNLDPQSPAYFQETIGDTVLFEVDQHVLTDVGRSTLTGQAQWLTTNTSYTAIIEGHADEQGTREYNLGLGSRRAAATRDFLVSQGVADNRLQIVTYGKERPLAICSTEECYSKNRRAVTVVAAGLGS